MKDTSMPAILWLAMLPRRQFNQAVKNIKSQRSDPNYTFNVERPNFNHTIGTSFCWDLTPQGEKYWHSIANDIKYK